MIFFNDFQTYINCGFSKVNFEGLPGYVLILDFRTILRSLRLYLNREYLIFPILYKTWIFIFFKKKFTDFFSSNLFWIKVLYIKKKSHNVQNRDFLKFVFFFCDFCTHESYFVKIQSENVILEVYLDINRSVFKCISDV